jgi:hypothetical protein
VVRKRELQRGCHAWTVLLEGRAKAIVAMEVTARMPRLATIRNTLFDAIQQHFRTPDVAANQPFTSRKTLPPAGRITANETQPPGARIVFCQTN